MSNYLTDRRKALGLTMKQVADAVGVSEATVSRWESGQIANMRRDRINSYAQILQTTPNFIMTGENDPAPAPMDSLNSRDKRDIAKDLAAFKETLENGEGLMFDGDPMSEEAKASILAAIETGLRVVKVMNKEKYTPKKYKKD